MHTSEVKARDTSSRSESAEAEHSPDREQRMARAENFYRATERTDDVAGLFFSRAPAAAFVGSCNLFEELQS